MQYQVWDFGAVGDGEQDDTTAIQGAIDACHAGGGGQVYVGPGVHMISTLELRSHVDLHLSRGAVLRGIYDSPDYRAIAPELNPMTALIFAREAEQVAVTGAGTIDAQGQRYWRRLDAPRSGRADVDEVGVIQFWYEHIKTPNKPNRLLAFCRCRGVMVQDVRLRNASAWTLHLISSRDVKIRGIDIENPLEGPNTDGIDVDGSSDVIISDCTIKTGDDAIVLKTNQLFGQPTPVRNVTVTNCRLYSGCNAFKIGTETMADVENVCFSTSVIYSPEDAPPVARCISGIALETVDGGHVRRVVCSNITMTNARTPLFIRRGARYRGDHHDSPGELRGLVLSHIVATGATHPSVISGIPGAPIADLQIQNLQVDTRGGGTRTPAEIGDVPEHPADYPEVFMFGEVPASVLYLRHVDRLRLQSCLTRLRELDARPAVYLDDVHDRVTDPTLEVVAALDSR